MCRANQSLTLPKGTYKVNNTDLSNNKVTLIGLEIYPESSLYPSNQSESKVLKLIGQAGLDIYLCRHDSLKYGPCSSQNADLSFSTQTIKPVLTYWFNDSIIEINAKNLKADDGEFSWRNKGGIESLVDLSEGEVAFSLSDRIINELDDEAFKLSERYLINGFTFDISDRIFTSFNLCKNLHEKYTQYYLKLPKEILQTHLNLECK